MAALVLVWSWAEELCEGDDYMFARYQSLHAAVEFQLLGLHGKLNDQEQVLLELEQVEQEQEQVLVEQEQVMLELEKVLESDGFQVTYSSAASSFHGILMVHDTFALQVCPLRQVLIELVDQENIV